MPGAGEACESAQRVVGGFCGQGLGKKVDRGGPERVGITAIEHPAVTVHAAEKADGDEVAYSVLDRALRGETELHLQLSRVHQALALGDGSHHRQPVLLAEHSLRELLHTLRLRVRHADMLLHDSRYAFRVTDIL